MRSVVLALFASYRDLQELMAERGLSVDHTTVWRWVQRYAPVLSQRIRRECRPPNRSWRVDETYVRVAGNWVYSYRAVDSGGDTIDFMLSPNRDLVAAKHFLQLTLHRTGQVWPRVINVDGHPAYATVCVLRLASTRCLRGLRLHQRRHLLLHFLRRGLGHVRGNHPSIAWGIRGKMNAIPR